MKEDEFRKKLFNYLSKNISGFNIDKEVPIPYKHIYLRKNRKITLEIWCFKQDIAVYKPLLDKSIGYRGSKILSKDNRQIQILLKKDNAQRTRHVGLPYVIIETKVRQPNTHDILTYSEKAAMIKTIFPYCKFVFCIYERISPRTFRHGVNFDEIICINNIKSQTELSKFEKTIRRLLKEAKRDSKKI